MGIKFKKIRTAPRNKLIDFKTFTTYRTSQNIPKKYYLNRVEFIKVANEIFKVIADHLIEKDGGVVIDYMGYFSHWRTPRPVSIKTYVREDGKIIVEDQINFHTNGHFYSTNLFTNVIKDNFLNGWTIDRSESYRFKNRRYKQLLSGKKYKCFYDVVMGIFQNKQYYEHEEKIRVYYDNQKNKK